MKTVTLAALACMGAFHGVRAGSLTYEQGPIPPGIGPAVPYLAAGEYGDDIQWNPKEDEPYAFTFSYHANYEALKGMTVRLYDQDGPKTDGRPAPGSVLWADFLDVQKGGGEVTIPLGNEFWTKAPPQLVFSVDFGKLTDGREAGLYAAGGPIADAYRDSRFWQRECSSEDEWKLVKFEGLTTAAAEFVASVRVTHLPEPSTWAMAGVGTVVLCMAGWRGRRTTAGCNHDKDATSRAGVG